MIDKKKIMIGYYPKTSVGMFEKYVFIIKSYVFYNLSGIVVDGLFLEAYYISASAELLVYTKDYNIYYWYI